VITKFVLEVKFTTLLYELSIYHLVVLPRIKGPLMPSKNNTLAVGLV